MIIDRYFLSTIAYQGASGIPIERIIKDHQKYNVPIPDLVFILDIPVKEAIKRLSESGKVIDSFEKKEEFLRKVREIYMNLNNYISCSIIILNATRDVEKIHNEIVNHVTKLLREKGWTGK